MITFPGLTSKACADDHNLGKASIAVVCSGSKFFQMQTKHVNLKTAVRLSQDGDI
jgi:hypothetical protein